MDDASLPATFEIVVPRSDFELLIQIFVSAVEALGEASSRMIELLDRHDLATERQNVRVRDGQSGDPLHRNDVGKDRGDMLFVECGFTRTSRETAPSTPNTPD
jgi:hypothetical protein